jgi:hypothetical protein
MPRRGEKTREEGKNEKEEATNGHSYVMRLLEKASSACQT